MPTSGKLLAELARPVRLQRGDLADFLARVVSGPLPTEQVLNWPSRLGLPEGR